MKTQDTEPQGLSKKEQETFNLFVIGVAFLIIGIILSIVTQ
jgi:hypothetical protein